MNRKETIHNLLKEISLDVFEFIKESELSQKDYDGWVPQTYINDKLSLKFHDVPKAKKQYGKRGWLFAIIARMLEDENLVEFYEKDKRSFYRSIKDAKH